MKKTLIIPHFLEAYRAKKLRVGFSGGADSTALLLLLLEWNFSAGQIEAVHFDHGLRGKESTADGLWCQDFCRERNIKFTLVKLDLSTAVARGCSLEDAARNARLEWYRNHDDNTPIVLAHHAGDVAENMLLKLARGSNVSSLNSLREERK
ncbi:MAG: tRNA lysidine(34) synthetase TilS, partial [Lentisphaeria bacterium]|nr:tRNA lysidine(34) synthetase TilS [Lentisphaeria bacterium]